MIRPRSSLRRLLAFILTFVGGLLAGTALMGAAVFALSRHVDYDWDTKFVALHDRWETGGIGPGGTIPPQEAPPPASDW